MMSYPVMQVAHENKIPVLPRAGGTSLAGQCVNHAIVMDFSKYMNQLIEVNGERNTGQRYSQG
ncbi:MAG: hypothetical protein CM1200mP15_21900 [Dehalococcoidia bacterium]|nr:MAG: hypothetical protein CM1200mP15_21900 [Dehalococcoidia bacterium]